MTTFHYTAKNAPGASVEGMIKAADLTDAWHQLTRAGFMPVEIKMIDQRRPGRGLTMPFLRQRIAQVDIVILTRQLANLTQCNLPVLNCLKLLAKRTRQPTLKSLLESMMARIEDGAMLSQAMADHTMEFSALYLNMVKAGELSGQLGEILGRVADFLEEDDRRAAQIKSALYYPVFVLGVGVLTVVVMLTFVVPKMSSLFDEFHAALPLPTKILLGASTWLGTHSILAILMSAFVAGSFQMWRTSPDGQAQMHRLVLRVPLYGEFLDRSQMTRLLRTLAMLLDNGVEITSALNSVRDMAQNDVHKVKLSGVLEDVAGGVSLSQAMREHGFDEAVSGLVQIGEESGDLPRNLYHCSAMYERETSAQAAAFISLLGPALLVVIVGMTGFVVTAFLLPIVQMDILVR